jgi:hypothetical protein
MDDAAHATLNGSKQRSLQLAPRAGGFVILFVSESAEMRAARPGDGPKRTGACPSQRPGASQRGKWDGD